MRTLFVLGAALFTLGAECDFSGIVAAICAEDRNHPVCPPNLHAFVTSSTHQGNLGGLDGADAICQNLAAESPLAGRSFVAWLSTSDVDARDRLTDGRFLRTDQKKVAESIADLTDGALTHAIQLTETGEDIGISTVWTGTANDGTLSGNTCADWTSSSGGFSGDRGQSNLTNSWTAGGSLNCAGTGRLYCFEVPE